MNTATGAAKFVGSQLLLRPMAALSTGVKDTLKFGAIASKDKAKATYNQFVNQTAALRGQRPGQAFVRKEQPKVMPGMTGCRDVRTFGGKTRKRSNKLYQTRRKRR